MLDLATIKKNYPENLQVFGRFLLKEYLQCKILQIIFNSEHGGKLCFLGGTALRVVYGNNRFSEDLDFDNFGLTEKDFDNLSEEIKKKMEMEGHEIEIRNVFKGVYRCYLRFPKLLNKLGLSGYEEEKILIQIDAMSQTYEYAFDKYLLNKFDVFTEINVAPKSILLSKKIGAIMGRKTLKGRDFYDVVFLFSLSGPDYEYLMAEVGVKDSIDLRNKMLDIVKDADLKELAKDVSPFLFNQDEIQRVLYFRKFVEQI